MTGNPTLRIASPSRWHQFFMADRGPPYESLIAGAQQAASAALLGYRAGRMVSVRSALNSVARLTADT